MTWRLVVFLEFGGKEVDSALLVAGNHPPSASERAAASLKVVTGAPVSRSPHTFSVLSEEAALLAARPHSSPRPGPFFY